MTVPFGAWHMGTGKWTPNSRLQMSEEDQHRSNLEGGHSCEHKFLPRACPFCESSDAKIVQAGAKFDAGKPPLHSVLAYFPRALEEVAKVCAHGETMHGYDTWSTIDNAERRYADADLRHEIEVCKGEKYDIGPKGSGLLHRAHRAWNALALLELELRRSHDATESLRGPTKETERTGKDRG